MDHLSALTSTLDCPAPALSRNLSFPFVEVDGFPFHYTQQEYSISGTELLVIGTSHTRDLSHPQMNLIRDALLRFNPDILLTEALPAELRITPEYLTNTPTDIFSSPEAATTRCGESGYAAFIVQKTALVGSPEVSIERQIASLLSLGFSLPDLYSYFGYRWNLQLSGACDPADVLSTFERGQERLANTLLENFLVPATLEQSQLLAAELWQGDVTPGNERFGRVYFSPMWEQLEGEVITVTNYVVEASCFIRDVALLRAISLATQRHKRIAVVYGCQHAVTCQNSFEFALANPTYFFNLSLG
jgi:hypothetical protein